MKKDESLFREAFLKYERAVEIKPDKHEAWYNWGIALLDLARMKKDESLFREAFLKYKRSVEIKPDKHEAWYNWGNALYNLARLKGDESLFMEAFLKYERSVQYIENSFKSAETVTEKTEVAGYWVHALSRLMFNAVQQKNRGQFKDYFHHIINLKTYFTDIEWNRRLVALINDFFLKENTPFFDEILGILKKKKLQEEIGLLQPYAIACEYWQKDEDAEVLEKLNPELREMVETIINKSEKMTS
jgi:tetratricopeptide (TPR) repeat protein